MIAFPIYLAFGTNIGNREKHLLNAIGKLTSRDIITFTNISNLYETEPKYFHRQPDFYNLVAEGQTELSVTELLSACKEIESEMGRDFDQFRNGPRIIDIDILFYSQAVVSTENLIIPHPRIAERRFVLQPLMDIAADFIHPLDGESIAELFKKCTDNARITKIKDIKKWISH